MKSIDKTYMGAASFQYNLRHQAGYCRGRIVRMILCAFLIAGAAVQGQNQLKRNRAEYYYDTRNSNTTGVDNLWVQLGALGHIWDDIPIKMDTITRIPTGNRWVSNVRIFPEVKVQAGIFDFAMLTFDSRVLTWAFKPGWVSGGITLTTPTKELRLHGLGLECKYVYTFSDGPPTLGGYVGFMPEGYKIKGGGMETNFLYELDLLAAVSQLPLRLLLNAGIRVPFQQEKRENYQLLANGCIAYNGSNYDLFVSYSLEAFNNLFSPKIFIQGAGESSKRYLVYFTENPMYLTLGGSIKYENGIALNFAVPLLLSVNQQSKMTRQDLQDLHRNSDKFLEEIKLGIRDPFDPWFVKWKVSGSISFPIIFKMTSSEMMRNYLILKNKKEEKKMDIDKKIDFFDESKSVPADPNDALKRLELIRKRREMIE